MATFAAKNRTRAATQRLIRLGELTPTPCQGCGAIGVETHHTSYDDPRAVEFLCPACHRQEHRCIDVGAPSQAVAVRSSASLDIRRLLSDFIGDRSLTDFAAEVGISQAALSRWMNGETTPSRRLVYRIGRRYPELRDLLSQVREEAAVRA